MTRPLIMLAPMAGFTDRTFRSLCTRFGCDCSFTEMVSAKGLYYSSTKTSDLLRLSPDEKNVSVQLFGSDPLILGKITERLCALYGETLKGIDLNAGCPAPKITSNGDGSALMQHPSLLKAILNEMVKNSTLPISIKLRKGWDEQHVNCVELAKLAEDCGVSQVTIHGRTRTQLYGGVADWDCIAQVKSALNIPVIANGDVKDAASALALIEHTHCDGIMIGRGSLGNPWIFSEIKAALNSTPYTSPTEHQRLELAYQHAQSVIADKGEHGIIELRKHIPFYIQGMKNAAALRQAANSARSLLDLRRILLDSYDGKTYNK